MQSENVIPIRARLRPRSNRRHDLEQMIGDAIRERRLLSIVYRDAVEPQTFAPYVLYCAPGKQVLVGGCEIARHRVTWRQFEVASAQRVTASDRRFVPGAAFGPGGAHRAEEVIAVVDVVR